MSQLVLSNRGNVMLTSDSCEDTHDIGFAFGACLLGGELIGVSGPLGAGKTEFVRGLAGAFGLQEAVSSPSYVLENIYSVSVPEDVDEERDPQVLFLCHWDLYRLGTVEDKNEILDYVEDPQRVVVVEWPEKAPWLQKYLHLQVYIDFQSSSQRSLFASEEIPRSISLSPGPGDSLELFETVREALIAASED